MTSYDTVHVLSKVLIFFFFFKYVSTRKYVFSHIISISKIIKDTQLSCFTLFILFNWLWMHNEDASSFSYPIVYINKQIIKKK